MLSKTACQNSGSFNPLDGEWARPGEDVEISDSLIKKRFNPLDGEWARPGKQAAAQAMNAAVSIPSTGNGRGRASKPQHKP